MPFVRICLKGTGVDRFGERVGETVHRAMVDAIGIPEGDHFQVITEQENGVVYDPSFLDIERSDGIVFIQITLAQGRSREVKGRLYARIADGLSRELAIRPQDVFITLLEIPTENFSFGNGEAQFADQLPPHLQPASS